MRASDAFLIVPGAFLIVTFSCDSDRDAPGVESLAGRLRSSTLVFPLFGIDEESCGISYNDSLTFSVAVIAFLSRGSEVVRPKFILPVITGKIRDV